MFFSIATLHLVLDVEHSSIRMLLKSCHFLFSVVPLLEEVIRCIKMQLARLDFSTNVEPPEINNGCEEEFVSQRSQAKRRWWQQMRNLTSQVNSGGPPVPLPKFLKAELCRADKAPEPVEGGALATSTTSRRSAAMKELWRKRKQAWLSAAAARAPAVPSQPEPQAQPCG